MLKIARDRFQGCLVGSVIGDCLGAPFEMQHWDEYAIPRQQIIKLICPKELTKKSIKFKYTGNLLLSIYFLAKG